MKKRDLHCLKLMGGSRQVATLATKSNFARSKTEFKFPDAVLFSDNAILKQRISTGKLISIISHHHNINISPYRSDSLWKQSLEKQKVNSPLYTPGKSVSIDEYKIWLGTVIKNTLQRLITFDSLLQDDVIRDKIQYRVYRSLNDPRSYFIQGHVLRLLRLLRKCNVPYGIIANSSPYFDSILRGVNDRIKNEARDLLYSEESGPIRYINAADCGIAKPDVNIFLEMLKVLKLQSLENIYYIGTDPLLDYEPTKSLGIKSVLLTSELENPKTDIKYLSPRLCRQKSSFRIADIREIEQVVFPKEVFGKPYKYRKKLKIHSNT